VERERGTQVSNALKNSIAGKINGIGPADTPVYTLPRIKDFFASVMS
jgi:hypothetical protein